MLKQFSSEEAANYHKLEGTQCSIAIGYTLTPDDKGFDDVTYYGESLHDVNGSNRKPEWIYVLANKHMPNILKIGFTATSVYQRVNQINAATGVISPWISVFTYKTCSGLQLEREIHKYLESLGTRINPSREGFDIQIDTAIDIIEKIGERYKFI